MNNMSRRSRQIIQFMLFFTFLFGIVLVVVKHAIKSQEHGKVDHEPISMVNLEIENARRIKKLEQTCRKYNLGLYKDDLKEELVKYPPAPQYSVFYIDTIHEISYCPIYKAGSTTWLYNLCLLMNISEEEISASKDQISTIARRVIPEMDYPEAEEAMSSTTKLLVVRHPFERLLSAYRDKLENSVAGREHGTLHFYRKYGASIVQKYRDDTFIPPRDDQVLRKEGVPQPAGIEPTWREFVEYLIDTDLGSYGDDHWMPYYLYCTPCSVNYTIIAKVETLNTDQSYAISKMGLEGRLQPKWRHGSGQSAAAKVYFTQLTMDQITQLYEKFKLDFEMFDYSPDSYYQYPED